MSAPIIRFLYFNKKFLIEKDASKLGAGAILSQFCAQDGISERLPMVYTSELLSRNRVQLRNY